MATPTTHRYGLIGYPLSHSFSRQYFREKFRRENLRGYDYQLFPIPDIAGLPALIADHPDLRGLNVTIPYKEQVLPYLDELDPLAAKVGAVNTIRVRPGHWQGFNSDVYGFMTSLRRWLQDQDTPTASLRALILGTGGAAKAVTVGLDQLGIPWQLVSRSPERAALTYPDLGPEHLAAHRLLINTTPLGMAPRPDRAPPIPYDLLTPEHLLYDLIYNPEETRFLQRGKARGCPTLNGLEMLYLQAEKSWAIWQGR